MAGKKAALPAPIDRPLSRAYLRQFKGWSMAYPPGVSDPASLRVMDNLLVNRDGSVKVRPGLVNLTRIYAPAPPATGYEPLQAGLTVVGGFEPFYLNDGSKAYLFAVRNDAMAQVEFRVAVPSGLDDQTWFVKLLSSVGVAFDTSGWATEPHFSVATTYVRYVQIDNRILALSNAGEQLILFHVGATKKVVELAELTMPFTAPTEFVTPVISADIPEASWINGTQDTFPTLGLPVLESIISNDLTLNDYNVAFVVTLSNEIGETGASNILSFRVQRAYGSWLWFPAIGGAGEAAHPNTGGGPLSDGRRSGDQIILSTVGTWLDDAIAAGATSLNVYAMGWSEQDAVPVELQLIARKPLRIDSTQAADGWVQIHPGLQALGPTLPIPTVDNRTNTTGPARAGQGLVAADRLVLVNDPTAAAVIRWTANASGDYLNFASSRGGGVKTLTSGNMQVPACVKLWQNPQSADTLTVLCMGTDGQSSAYYMAPATVTSQSDNTLVMGFEETTATPGTTSPFGCEVANNALYHPLDDQLMKSTASNYNINHKAMTDQIAPAWQALADKKQIVSCFFDQRLYYLVHNPDGAALEAGCNGNEVWVLDLAAEGGSWSRWTAQGVSLKRVEDRGRVLLALVRPDGIFAFDDQALLDDYVDETHVVAQRPIAWSLVTNTQGANRAHDAWAHLRQVGITLGNFTGRLRYGVRGWDMHGQLVEIEKVYAQKEHTLAGGDGLPFDDEDFLRIARDLKEWSFFASSLPGEQGTGQLSLVQYRYTPVSVNVGYEYGSVETFEYGRAVAEAPTQTTDNGIPLPYLDPNRP